MAPTNMNKQEFSFAGAKVVLLFDSTKFFRTFLSKKFKICLFILIYIRFYVLLQAIKAGFSAVGSARRSGR
jgi:hypothetical protein